MKPIAIDCRQLPLGPSGDRSYLLHLLAELFALQPTQEWLLCYQGVGETGLDALPAGARECRFEARPGWLWTPWQWPRALRAAGAGLAFAQYLIPPLSPCPTVAAIHDVSFLTHPEWFVPRAVRVMRRLIPLSARRATRVVCGSHHAAGEIADLCRVPASHIQVIPYAAAGRFRPGDPDAATARARAYGLHGRYVLAVGLIQPRKNLPRLLEAFAQVSADRNDVQLAVVGRSGWGVAALQERIAALSLEHRVVLCGAVPDDDLPALYQAATVFCYPSLHEGFGLPPLEAMSCGTPVVASSTTSLPEVVGDAGLLVHPTDVSAIAGALALVLDDTTLASDLARRGLERAAQFSWRRCAQEHWALFAALLSSR